jgi:hypothetical protein
MHFHNKSKSVTLFRDIIAVYYENYMNTMSGQNAEPLNSCGTYSNHCIWDLPLLRQLVTSFHRRDPGSIRGQVMWDVWWKKWQWSRFSASTSVSPTNSHSTNCSMLIYHLGLVQ